MFIIIVFSRRNSSFVYRYISSEVYGTWSSDPKAALFTLSNGGSSGVTWNRFWGGQMWTFDQTLELGGG